MKKYYLIFTVFALAMIVALPTISRAEDSIKPTISNRMRADIKDRQDNLRNNIDERNDILKNSIIKRNNGSATSTIVRDCIEDRRNGTSTNPTSIKDCLNDRGINSSTTRRMMKDYKNEIKEDKRDARASTTMERREDRNEMRTDVFAIRKNFVLKQFATALANLTNIRERINSRITKEQQGGTNMSASVTALASANAKIAIVKTDILNLTNYLPVATSTLGASGNIDLKQARDLIKKAQDSIKDAQKSLTETVRIVIKDMGLTAKSETQASSTSQ